MLVIEYMYKHVENGDSGGLRTGTFRSALRAPAKMYKLARIEATASLLKPSRRCAATGSSRM